MRRFTRLTNAFSKKFENHCHALALYFFWYNWTRQHKAHRLSPAMAAGLTGKLWSMSDLAVMVDDALPKPGSAAPTKNGRRECSDGMVSLSLLRARARTLDEPYNQFLGTYAAQ